MELNIFEKLQTFKMMLHVVISGIIFILYISKYIIQTNIIKYLIEMKTKFNIPPYENIDTSIESNRRVLGLYFETIFKNTYLDRTRYKFKKSENQYCVYDFYYRTKTKHIYLELKTRLIGDFDNVNYVDYEKLQKYKKIRDNTPDRICEFYYVYNHITDFENILAPNRYYIFKINFDDFDDHTYYKCVKQNKISYEIPIKILRPIDEIFPKRYNENKEIMMKIEHYINEMIKLQTIIMIENTKYNTLNEHDKIELFENHKLFQEYMDKKNITIK